MRNANRTHFGANTRKAKAALSHRLEVALAVLFANAIFVRAQVMDISVRINFPFDSAVLDTNYMSNSDALETLDNIAKQAIASNTVLDVVTYSSPEGNYTYNLRLSQKRAKSISDYLTSRFPGIGLNIITGAEAWDELRSSVIGDARLDENSRSSILVIIDSSVEPDTKEKQLKANSSYNSLYSNYFANLRYANISLKIQDKAQLAKDSAKSEYIVYFSLSEDFIRPDYMGNEANLEAIRRILSIPENRQKEIVLEGTASPEGPVSINERLGNARAKSLADWLISEFPDLEGRIVIRPKGEDWEGLRAQVDNSSTISPRDKKALLSIIDSNATPEKKEQLLKAHKAYRIVDKEILPYIRYARFADFEATMPATVSETETVKDTTSHVADTITTQPADTTATLPKVDTIAAKPGQDSLSTWTPGITTPGTQVAKRGRNTVAAIKTNLLYDAATALNVELEFPIWDRLSVMVEDVFPWWEWGNKYCFEIWEMGVEARYWFKSWKTYGTEKLRGWFAGPYVMSAKYDFQFDTEVNYQGEMWSVGATAGYAMPIGRRKRANLEFSLSLGYMKSPYRHYLPTDDYLKLIHDPSKDGTFYNYFLYPTKAKVSLVLPISIPTWKEVRYE